MTLSPDEFPQVDEAFVQNIVNTEQAYTEPEFVNEGPSYMPIDGFPFTKDSPIRQLTEPSNAFFVPYIAGLTIMDDRIATAVDAHSSFTEHPWARLIGTGSAALKLVFGKYEESLAMSEKLWTFHQTIRGTENGLSYSANDATAQRWVLGAVFNGMQEARRRTTRDPFTDEQRDGLYADIKTFGTIFGVKPTLMPSNVASFNDFWEERLDGDSLLRTDASRRMAQTVFRFSSPQVPKLVGRIGQTVSIASLDSRLQDRADLHLTPQEVRIAKTFDLVMKNSYGVMPEKARQTVIPAFFAARRAVGKVSKQTRAAA